MWIKNFIYLQVKHLKIKASRYNVMMVLVVMKTHLMFDFNKGAKADIVARTVDFLLRFESLLIIRPT